MFIFKLYQAHLQNKHTFLSMFKQILFCVPDSMFFFLSSVACISQMNTINHHEKNKVIDFLGEPKYFKDRECSNYLWIIWLKRCVQCLPGQDKGLVHSLHSGEKLTTHHTVKAALLKVSQASLKLLISCKCCAARCLRPWNSGF